jgi:hypothetical protein
MPAVLLDATTALADGSSDLFWNFTLARVPNPLSEFVALPDVLRKASIGFVIDFLLMHFVVRPAGAGSGVFAWCVLR